MEPVEPPFEKIIALDGPLAAPALCVAFAARWATQPVIIGPAVSADEPGAPCVFVRVGIQDFVLKVDEAKSLCTSIDRVADDFAGESGKAWKIFADAIRAIAQRLTVH